MRVDTNISLTNNRYRVTVRTLEPTAAEEELFQKFGEPLVETGGEFSGNVTRPGESPESVSFTLPTSQYRIFLDFPVVQVFDLGDDPDSDLYAKLFANTILDRITAARDSVLAQAAPFVGRNIVTI